MRFMKLRMLALAALSYVRADVALNSSRMLAAYHAVVSASSASALRLLVELYQQISRLLQALWQ
jgi:hypothetical protein